MLVFAGAWGLKWPAYAYFGTKPVSVIILLPRFAFAAAAPTRVFTLGIVVTVTTDVYLLAGAVALGWIANAIVRTPFDAKIIFA